MTTYIPGTLEDDPKKIVMSLQQLGPKVDTIESAYVTTIGGNSGAFTLNATSGITNSTNDIILEQASSSQFGAIKVDNNTISASSGIVSTIRAAKADQVTGTDANKAITPSVQQNHLSAVKAWVNFTPGASPTINASYNVSSVTHNGTGDYTVNFTTSFADANFAAHITSVQTTGTTGVASSVSALAVGSVRFQTYNFSGASGDPVKILVICAGNQ